MTEIVVSDFRELWSDEHSSAVAYTVALFEPRDERRFWWARKRGGRRGPRRGR